MARQLECDRAERLRKGGAHYYQSQQDFLENGKVASESRTIFLSQSAWVRPRLKVARLKPGIKRFVCSSKNLSRSHSTRRRSWALSNAYPSSR